MSIESRTRLTSRRKPLEDASSRANQGTISPHSNKSRVAASNSLPHHESLVADGALTVRNATTVSGHKRLSALTTEDQAQSKRDSQISTTSTNASAKGRRRKTHIGPWQLGRDLGKGGCGKVRKVRHSVTGQIAAVKIISKVTAEKARAESLANLVEITRRPRAGALAAPTNVMPFGVEREVVIMKLLQHENIVKLYDVWENRNELYLIIEYVDGGELFEHIENSESLAEDETVYLFRQIVAALLHCHRLGIHHRDLKPENILITRTEGRIKLVDFGMAALQPQGKKLTTPCGSLHYAAPEVFEKNYDGSKVDVWSLGIILYVMLTGTTPFEYDVPTMVHNVNLWYNVLKAGIFDMPDDLSAEAQDLIRRMLIPDPQRRISLEATWHHPFIHKYDALWDETPEINSMENWIGPLPVIPDWTLQERKNIDREIFRNIRSLWHSEDEGVLIEKLLCKEPNQEKFFYSTLQRHRDDQLENYVGTSESIGYSASDYHHIKPVFQLGDAPQMPSAPSVKSRSQYSILNDEHLNSRSTLHEPPPSIGSYDPFRASRDAMVGGNGNYVKVNVLGRQSKSSRRNSVASSAQIPQSLRVGALKHGHKHLSTNSSPTSLRNSTSSQKAHKRRSMSRSSLGSSLAHRSPATGTLRPRSHKRTVDFSHLRRNSNASVLTSRSGGARSPADSQKPQRKMREQRETYLEVHGPNASPVTHLNTVVSSRKEGLRAKDKRRPPGQDEVIDMEARKVSTELEKYCEEVFFRTSTGSSSRTSATPSQVVDTPPSSISNRGSGPLVLHQSPSTVSQRPLPALPVDHSNGFIKQELIETRNRLAARYAQDHDDQNATIHEVLAHLDALLLPESTIGAGRGIRRPVSTGTARLSQLPIISEEERLSDADFNNGSKSTGSREALAIPTFSFHGPTDEPQETIRKVDSSSPSRVAPLVIRKTSGSSTMSQPRQDAPGSSKVYNHPGWVKSKGRLSLASSMSLENITEENSEAQHGDGTGQGSGPGKKVNWFRRRLQNQDSLPSKRRSVVFELDDRTCRGGKEHTLTKAKRVLDNQTTATAEGGGQRQPAKGLADKRPGFLRFLRRNKGSPKTFGKQISVAVDEWSSPSMASTTGFSTPSRDANANGGNASPTSFRHHQQHTLDTAEQNDPRDLGVQQSWLARFFHLKPATHILCFCVGRGIARQETVRALRGWHRFGMRDIVLDRGRNLVFARLDAVNHLGIKEVSFVVELYVMLAQGKKARLSVCRFTQRNGAASSFRRVVEALESVLRGKSVLVDRGEMWREMEGVLVSG